MGQEALVHQSRIAVPYAWSAGTVGTRFLRTLAEEGRFLATRCPECRKVFLPPAKTCGRCLVECAQWLEVGPGGVLLSFTQAEYDSPAHPWPNPIYGLIRLDGADTALLHVLKSCSPADLTCGMRVEPAFHQPPGKGLLGILHFRPERKG